MGVTTSVLKRALNVFKNQDIKPEAVEEISQNEKYVDEIYRGRLGGILSEMEETVGTPHDIKMRLKMLRVIYEQDLELTQLRAVNDAKLKHESERMTKIAELEKQLLALKDVK